MSLSQVEEPVEARTGIESIWARLRVEAASAAAEEPILASFLNAAILRHDKFSGALAYRIAAKLADAQLDSMLARDVAEEALAGDPPPSEPACRRVGDLARRVSICKDQPWAACARPRRPRRERHAGVLLS